VPNVPTHTSSREATHATPTLSIFAPSAFKAEPIRLASVQMFQIVVFFNLPTVVIGFRFTFATLQTAGAFLWHDGTIRVELRVGHGHRRPVVDE